MKPRVRSIAPFLPIILLCLLTLMASGLHGSGLRVVGNRQEGSPTVTFRVLLQSGSIDDPKGKEGLSALTLSVLAKGGTGEMDYKAVLDRLYPMAASIEAFPDKEVMVLEGQCPANELEEFYLIFRGLITTPRFDPADFEREKNNAIDFIRSTLRGNDDELLAKTALDALIYRGHPYAHPVAGTLAGLEGITREDLLAFHRGYFTLDNVTVGLIGGYPADFEERLGRDFAAGLPVSDASRQVVELPPVSREPGIEVLLIEKPCRSNVISMGHPLEITRRDRDHYPLMLANSFLGEHRTFNGLLMIRMRMVRGLNYGDYSYVEHFIQDGWSTFARPNIPRTQQDFSIWIRPVAPENAHFSMRLAIHETSRLIEGGLSPEAFEKTRQFLLGYSKLWRQSPSRRIGILLDSIWYGLENDYIRTIEDRFASLAVEEANTALKKYLHPSDLKVVIICEDAEGLRDRLLRNAPSPIVYQDPGSTTPELLAEDERVAHFPLPIRKVEIVKVEEMFED